jgi:hypothetical protein
LQISGKDAERWHVRVFFGSGVKAQWTRQLIVDVHPEKIGLPVGGISRAFTKIL